MKKNYYLKKLSFFISFIIILLLSAPLQSSGKFHSFTIKIKNLLHLERNDQWVIASVSAIKERYMDFDENNFRIKSKGKSIPFDQIGRASCRERGEISAAPP